MDHTSLPLLMKFCRASVAVDPDVFGGTMLSLNFLFISQCFLPLISVAQQTQTGTYQSVQSHQSYWDFDDVETVQLFARDGADGDYYGRGMAICGDNIVIGSSLDTFKGVQSGTAYIYSRGGSTAEWNIIGKLFPSLGGDDDHFGWSVACDHNYTIVGAYGDDSNYENGGAVYLFAEIAGKYVEDGIFYPSGQVKNENFGWSVAIHGNLVVIGARGNSELYTQCGAVYIFRRIDSSDGTNANGDDYVPVGWVLDDILVPPTQSAYMSYGWSVSLYRNTLVIGAPRADYFTGFVYVYTRNTTYNNYDDDQYYSGEAIGYELVSILKSPDPQTKSCFGQSVSIYEDLIVVGQYLRVVSLSGRDLNGGDDDSSYEITPGGAFVYQKNTISKIGAQRGLRSPYPQQWGAIADLGSLVGYQDYEMFGYSVAVFHDLIAIGAPGDSVIGINSSVYIFSSDDSSGFQTWVPITSGWGEFKTSDRQKGKLGSSLALSEGLVLVGDPECVNVMTSLQTGCAYSWFGINRNGHGHDDNTPPDKLLLSDSYETLWISFTVFFSIGLCCILVVLLHRSLKRVTVDVVLEDMMTGDIQRMPYNSAHSSFSSLSNSISSFNSSHLPEWLHRYSDNTNDWLFGGNEMRPIRLSSDMDDSDRSTESGRSYTGHSSYHGSHSSSSFNGNGGIGRSNQTSNPIHSTRNNLLTFMQGTNLRHTTRPGNAMMERRNRNRQDVKRIMSTAKAIADDDSHPNQDEVSELIRTYDRDWITDEKFIEEVQRYFV